MKESVFADSARRSLVAALAACVALLATAGSAQADTATVQKVSRETGKPARLEAATIQTTATVEAIDHKTRKLTLRKSDGALVTLDVGPDIKRLDEVAKGDLLEVQYVESIAIAVLQPGEQDSTPDGAYSVLIRNPTQNPSGKLIDTETMSATVESVDLERRVVGLLRSDGTRVAVPVSPEVKRLAEVRKGDTVQVRYTRSMALSVHKPESK